MLIDLLKEAIIQNIGALKPASKGWLKKDCMLCATQGHGHDKRKRFGIQFNPTSIVVNCFNCGFSTSFQEEEMLNKKFKFFLKQIGVDQTLIEKIDFEIYKQKNQIKATREGDDEKTPEDLETRLRNLFNHWGPVSLPEDSFTIEQWLENGMDDPIFLKVVEYLLSRKIYSLNEFYWSPDTKMNINERFIIPYHYRNRIVGFTSRLSYDTNEKEIPKYYQQCPNDFVYNLDPQQGWSRKYTIVCEGVLDAWAVGGVATMGEIGQTKIDIINRLNKQVIVCPDRDKKGGDLVKAAIDNNWAVSFPRWGLDNGKYIKDAAQASEKYGRLLTTHSIIESAETNKTKIELNWKISQNERRKYS